MITEYQNLAQFSSLSDTTLRGKFLHAAFRPRVFYYYKRSNK